MKHTFKEYENALDVIGDIVIREDEWNLDTIGSSSEEFSILIDMFEDLKNASQTVNIKRVEVFDNRKGR